MKFIIVSTDNEHKTMVIDWGYTRQNHPIPETILTNPNLTEDEVSQIIETLRPERLEAIELPTGLQGLINKADQELSQQMVDDEVLL